MPALLERFFAQPLLADASSGLGQLFGLVVTMLYDAIVHMNL